MQVYILLRKMEGKSVAITKRTHAITPAVLMLTLALRAEKMDTQGKIAGARKSKAVAKEKEKAEAKEREKILRRTRLDGNLVSWDRKPQHPGDTECMR